MCGSISGQGLGRVGQLEPVLHAWTAQGHYTVRHWNLGVLYVSHEEINPFGIGDVGRLEVVNPRPYSDDLTKAEWAVISYYG